MVFKWNSCINTKDTVKLKLMNLSSGNQRWWVMANVSVGTYMATLDTSVVNLSLPTIIQSLNTNLGAVAWVVMTYLVVITGCLLLMGRLADLFGQRRIYLLGYLTFTIGSAFCSFSPTIYFLIGARMLQGLGASALMAIGPAIFTTTFRKEERGQVLGILGSVVSAGFLTGPILGGFLVEHLGWRSIFYINLPIGAIGIFLTLNVLTKDGPAKKVQVDLFGALMLFLFVSFLLFSLNRAGQGSTPLLWGSLLMTLFCFGLFFITELQSSSPLVDLSLFRERLFISGLGAGFLSFWMAGAHSFVAPFFFQNILGFSPSRVGMLIFPVALTSMIFAPLGGRFSDRVGARIPATVGLILTSFIIFSFTWLKEGVSYYPIIWRQIVIGIGIALFNPANNSAIINSLSRDKVGLASGLLSLSRNLGIAIGIAFAEMIIAFRLPQSPGVAGGSPSLESIHDVWRLIIIIGLMGVFLSWTRGSRSET